MIRGIAALLVCIGHLRAFLMVDYQPGSGILAQGFYFITGLHHQAVVIFFVLSGYLVGGSVIARRALGTWEWQDYALRRMTRLWVVLIPALALTYLFDRLGAAHDPAAYSGALFPQLLSGPTDRYDLGLSTLIGNIVFLQTIVVPVFGSNGPLWSLSNEAICYLLFPIGMACLARWPRLVSVLFVALIAILYAVPLVIRDAGIVPRFATFTLVWLSGAAAFGVVQAEWLSRTRVQWLSIICGLALLVLLPVGRQSALPIWDIAIGLAFAGTMPWLVVAPSPFVPYRRVALALSEISYTLYAVHFPVLAWLYFRFAAPGQMQFGPTALAVMAVVLAVTMGFAGAMWWLFERNTDRVRAILQQWLRRLDMRGRHA